MDTLFRERYIDHILRRVERVRSGAAGGKQSSKHMLGVPRVDWPNAE